MRTFSCSCGNQLFFDNVACMNCKREVGWCPTCAAISDVTSDAPGAYTCSHCSTRLVKCSNFANFNVCNRLVTLASDAVSPTAATNGAPTHGAAAGSLNGAANGSAANDTAPGQSSMAGTPQAGSTLPNGAPTNNAPLGSATPGTVPAAPSLLCDSCRYNHTIPDLSVAGNREKWYRLEAAKRRTLCDLQLVGFPFGGAKEGISPALMFEFKSDNLPDRVYRGIAGGQKVYTGHDNGVITINIQEADDALREKLRIDMGEAQRSLLGHFRHEFGHYVWDVLIKDRREADSIAVFGDHRQPEYNDALQAYYKNGPKPNWLLNYVSAYATMHPWEDFAETFAVYLDMVSALDTAAHGQLIAEPDLTDLDSMIKSYQKLGIALNELNRNNGVTDFLPEVIAPPIQEKLRFIHGLARLGQKSDRAPAAPIAAPEPMAVAG